MPSVRPPLNTLNPVSMLKKVAAECPARNGQIKTTY